MWVVCTSQVYKVHQDINDGQVFCCLALQNICGLAEDLNIGHLSTIRNRVIMCLTGVPLVASSTFIVVQYMTNSV